MCLSKEFIYCKMTTINAHDVAALRIELFKFINYLYINVSCIAAISKFNSLLGHAYYGGNRANLKCQSQKHYLKFK